MHLVPQDGTNSSTFESGLPDIHTTSVPNTIRNQELNPILNALALPSKEETSVKRSQLQSRYNFHLYSYLNHIDQVKNPYATCKDCNLEVHTTTYIFDCPSNHTHLTPTALWKHPVATAEFLTMECKEGVG